MRLATILLGTLLALSTLGCSDDTNPPAPDQKVATPDQKIAGDNAVVVPDKTVAPDKSSTTADKSTAIPDAPFFEAGIPNCAYEKDLSKVTLPCVCVKTVVYDVAVQFPACTSPLKVVCCPSQGKPICE